MGDPDGRLGPSGVLRLAARRGLAVHTKRSKECRDPSSEGIVASQSTIWSLGVTRRGFKPLARLTVHGHSREVDLSPDAPTATDPPA